MGIILGEGTLVRFYVQRDVPFTKKDLILVLIMNVLGNKDYFQIG
jgi:hypothetical protein